MKRQAAGQQTSAAVAAMLAADPEGPWPLWVLRGDDHGVGEPIGTLDSGPMAYVDERGLIGWEDGRWSLDWWVRTDEGWKYPSRTRAVRQAIDATPIIETSFAVPGGDLVARVAAVQLSGEAVVTVDYTNDSPTAVALALALRPIDLDGIGMAESVKIYDNTMSIGGRVQLVADRIPASSVAVSDFASLPPAVERANAEPSTEATSTNGTAQAASVFAMPHHSTLRVVLGADAVVADLPQLEAIAKGWSAHLDQFLEVEVEGSPIGDELSLVERRLATALRGGKVVRTRAAMGEWSALDDLSVATALMEMGDVNPAAEIVLDHLDSDRLLAMAAGEREAAFDALVRLWHLTRRSEVIDAASETLDVPAEVLAGPTPDAVMSQSDAWPVQAARRVHEIRSAFVIERDGELHLLTGFAEDWRGRSIDVRRARTAAGWLSFSLRWHGARPALLWSLEPLGQSGAEHDTGSAPAIVVRAPTLDAEWVAFEADGEALLAEQPV